MGKGRFSKELRGGASVLPRRVKEGEGRLVPRLWLGDFLEGTRSAPQKAVVREGSPASSLLGILPTTPGLSLRGALSGVSPNLVGLRSLHSGPAARPPFASVSQEPARIRASGVPHPGTRVAPFWWMGLQGRREWQGGRGRAASTGG